MRQHLRSFFSASAFAFAVAAALPRDATASTSIALSVADLAASADMIVRVTQLERASAWEDGRIVTTTRVRVDGVIAGTPPASELSVRTLGGVVGSIGQWVEGEAELAPNEQAILFLAPVNASSAIRATRVVGRAQGRWSIARDSAAHEIVRVRTSGQVVARRAVGAGTVRAAVRLATALDGAPVEDAAREAAREWTASHAR